MHWKYLLPLLFIFCLEVEACERENYDVFPPWGNALTDVLIPTEEPIVKAYTEGGDAGLCLVVEIIQRKIKGVSNGYYIEVEGSFVGELSLPVYAVYEIDQNNEISKYRFPLKLGDKSKANLVIAVRPTSNHGGHGKKVLASVKLNH